MADTPIAIMKAAHDAEYARWSSEWRSTSLAGFIYRHEEGCEAVLVAELRAVGDAKTETVCHEVASDAAMRAALRSLAEMYDPIHGDRRFTDLPIYEELCAVAEEGQ